MNFQKSFIVHVSQIKIASVVLPKSPLIITTIGIVVQLQLIPVIGLQFRPNSIPIGGYIPRAETSESILMTCNSSAYFLCDWNLKMTTIPT